MSDNDTGEQRKPNNDRRAYNRMDGFNDRRVKSKKFKKTNSGDIGAKELEESLRSESLDTDEI